MKTIFKLTILTMLIFAICAFKSVTFNEVKGWSLVGSDAGSYEIATEKSVERNGNVAILRSTKTSNGFGTIMQSFSAKNYLGKRIKLTAYIKSNGVKDWAGMWLRIDGMKNEVLGFDNMQNRAIKGETTWAQYAIVLDVPNESKNIAYGVLLNGEGQVWMDDFKFESVDTTVVPTQMILKTGKYR